MISWTFLINSVGFNSTSANSATNSISILNHGFETGEKVFYSTPSNNLPLSGLSTGNYYIYKNDENDIKTGIY